MLVAVVAHLVLAAFLPVLVRRLGRRVFLLAAVVPAGAFGWLLTRVGAVVDGERPTETVRWASAIDLEFAVRLGPLPLLMALLVTGVGALVMIYAYSYHAHHGTHHPSADTATGPAGRGGGHANGSAAGSPDSAINRPTGAPAAGAPAAAPHRPAGPGFGRGSAALLAFAGSMLGLVVSDDLLTLYLFWELTTVFSFLLIGQAGLRARGRRSAVQALLITTFGGLAMLFGFVMLAHAAGSYRISEIVADPPGGTAVSVALVLVLLGALSKSAQVPFHTWLPAAMVAPTPVSAYLHAAAMVKAGVFLIATLAPAFADVAAWQLPAVVVGATTMILGGTRALRQHDLKRLLAFGTISQLGFLTALVGFGSRTAALAGATLILGHALFKATLFMVVGIIDHQAGTRDLRLLSGLWRRMPVVFAAALLAGASMAGLPPFLGFLGKEAAFAALVHGGARELALLAVLVVGSVLTTAYTLRFLWGAFGSQPGVALSAAPRPTVLFALPVTLLALAGLGLGIGYPAVDKMVSAYAAAFPSDGQRYHLALWHGLGWPVAMSAIALAGGALVFALTGLVTRLRLPSVFDAQRGYEQIVFGVEYAAVAVTGRTQVGSLPLYLSVILVILLAVPGLALLTGTSWPGDLPGWDYWIQIPLAALVLSAALAVVRARSRLTATLLLGAVGYGIGALFVIDGAPDLALAQMLVESLSLIAFVFVLRRMPVRFSAADRSPPLRMLRIGIAAAVGVFVACFAIVTSGSRSGLSEPSQEYLARSPEETGATNVVNAILVDFRAFDTLGEISVLAVAAIGVASLLLFVRTPHGRTIDWLAADRSQPAPTGAVETIDSIPAGPAPAGSAAAEADATAAASAADSAPTSSTSTESTSTGSTSTGSTSTGSTSTGSASTGSASAGSGSTGQADDDEQDDAGRIRSVLLEVTARAVFPVVLVFSLYLLFAGHTRTGGGFSGGLVAGLAFVLRYVAGRRRRVGAAVPVVPTAVIGTGLAVAATAGLAPALFGKPVLDSFVFKGDLPVLGHVELVTSLFFDIGVYILIIGVVLELLRTLGTAVDKEADFENLGTGDPPDGRSPGGLPDRDDSEHGTVNGSVADRLTTLAPPGSDNARKGNA